MFLVVLAKEHLVPACRSQRGWQRRGSLLGAEVVAQLTGALGIPACREFRLHGLVTKHGIDVGGTRVAAMLICGCLPWGTNLHIYGVRGCGGVFHDGDTATLSSTLDDHPVQTITSP